MKKIILTFVTVLSIVACKKSETTSANGTEDAILEAANSAMMEADSVYTSVGNFPTLSKSQTDSAITAIKGIATQKIKELKDEKKLLTEKVAKEIDSATRTSIISEIKITQNKIDSVKNKVATTIKKEKIAPKIIKETKVIYRENPEPKVLVSAPKITKTGELEIQVDDLQVAQEMAKEQIAKYDGKVTGEQISSYENKEYNYLKVTLPLEKSEYLIQDLERNVGNIISRNIEITGEEYGNNSICNLEITLFNDSKDASIISTPTSFGGRTWGAIGSGWNVIQEIFLFILPFWPVFLIGGGIYYFVKKKKTQDAS